MDEIENVRKAVLSVFDNGLDELIEIIHNPDAFSLITDADISKIAMEREGFRFSNKLYFAGFKSSGKYVAGILRAARKSPTSCATVLEMLEEEKKIRDKYRG